MDETHVTFKRQYFESYEWRSETFTRGQAWIDLLALPDAQGKIERSQNSLSARWKWPKAKVLKTLREWEKEGKIVLHPTPTHTDIYVQNRGVHCSTSQATPKQAETTVKSGADIMAKFPLKDGSEWGLTREKFEQFRSDFPNLNVRGELRKAKSYVINNPLKQKTKRGMPRYLNAWLTRHDDPKWRSKYSGASEEAPNPRGEQGTVTKADLLDGVE